MRGNVEGAVRITKPSRVSAIARRARDCPPYLGRNYLGRNWRMRRLGVGRARTPLRAGIVRLTIR